MGHANPQFDSLGRLAHLDGIASAKHLAAADLGAKIRTARDDLHRVRNRLRDIEADNAFAGRADAEIARLNSRITELQTTIDRLEARRSAANDEWNAAARTHARALERAKERGLPTPLEINGDLS